MNEASVNIPVPAFWWADVAFLSGVYLSVPTSSDRLLQRELEGQRSPDTCTRTYAHGTPRFRIPATLGITCLSHFCLSDRCKVTPDCCAHQHHSVGPTFLLEPGGL